MQDFATDKTAVCIVVFVVSFGSSIRKSTPLL